MLNTLIKKLTVIATFLMASNLCVAEIYRCEDSSGKVNYKDLPCNNKTTKTQSIITLDKINIDQSGVDSNVSAPSRVDKSVISEGPNLLLNGDFSQQASFWELNSEDIFWSADKGTLGSGALLMNAALPPENRYIHETRAEQCVVLKDHEKFILSARVVLEKAPKRRSAHRANVVWFQTEDCSTGGTFGTYIEPKASVGRQLIISNYLNPTMAAVAAKIELVQLGKHSNQGNVIWDDISFTAVGVKEVARVTSSRPVIHGNYIQNGNFSRDLKNWRGSATWSSFVGHNSGGSALTTLRSQKGSRGTSVLTACAVLGNAQQLKLGGYVKINQYASSQKGGGRLRLSWYDSNNCSGKYQSGRKHADIQNVEGWQHLEVPNFSVPATAKSASIQLIQSIKGSGVFAVNWDDLYLMKQ